MNIWPWSRIRALEATNDALHDQNERDRRSARARRLELLASNERIQSQLNAKTVRLERIAALETPRCANIGKRMAKIARGEA